MGKSKQDICICGRRVAYGSRKCETCEKAARMSSRRKKSEHDVEIRNGGRPYKKVAAQLRARDRWAYRD